MTAEFLGGSDVKQITFAVSPVPTALNNQCTNRAYWGWFMLLSFSDIRDFA